MFRSPEQIIKELGGRETLNILFVRMLKEANDSEKKNAKGKRIDENDIFDTLSEQTGIEVTTLKSVLTAFWKENS